MDEDRHLIAFKWNILLNGKLAAYLVKTDIPSGTKDFSPEITVRKSVQEESNGGSH